MLVSIPSPPPLPAKPQSKDNSNSYTGDGEEFLEHLGAKTPDGREAKQPELAEKVMSEPQLKSQDDVLGIDGEFIAIDNAIFDVEIGSMPVKPLAELSESQKILHELRFPQIANRQELELAQPTHNEEVLVPTLEAIEEQATSKIAPPVADKIIPNAPLQIATLGNGLVREMKPAKDKNDKPTATVSANLQTSLAGKLPASAPTIQIQADTVVQPKIDLPQDRASAGDADLEKTARSLDMKVNTAPVSVDPSSSKSSFDGHVPVLSQSSQTLVRAIQENSNWTKVLNTSSVQLDSTQKIDGTVLQKLDIHLNLSTLGKLDVKLRLQQGELQIQIRTDSEQAFKALSLDQDALANTIKGLGYKVDTIAISGPRPDGGFQMNSNAQAQSQHHSAEHQSQNGNPGQRTDREFMPMKDADNDTIPSSIVENTTSDVDVI